VRHGFNSRHRKGRKYTEGTGQQRMNSRGVYDLGAERKVSASGSRERQYRQLWVLSLCTRSAGDSLALASCIGSVRGKSAVFGGSWRNSGKPGSSQGCKRRGHPEFIRCKVGSLSERLGPQAELFSLLRPCSRPSI
jgi:hypothetical protein